MKPSQGKRLKRALLVLGLGAALAACSSSSPPVADGGDAHAEVGAAGAGGGDAHADVGAAGAGGGDAHAEVGDAHPDAGDGHVEVGDARAEVGDADNLCRPWGSDMLPAAKCADTFDAQKASPPPLQTNPFVESGSCGGFLVWLNYGTLYALACIYDPTTKMLVGGRYAGDTGGSCTGVGKDLPTLCLSNAPYRAPAR